MGDTGRVEASSSLSVKRDEPASRKIPEVIPALFEVRYAGMGRACATDRDDPARVSRQRALDTS